MFRLLRSSYSAAALVLSVSVRALEHGCLRARQARAFRMAALSALAVTGAIVVAGCGAGTSETVTVTKHGHRVVRTRTVTVTETSTIPDVATNLTVTPRVRYLVHLAAVEGMTTADRKQTKGPLPGMYYGEYRGVRYALATVSFPLTGTTDQPSLYVQLPNQPWFLWVTEVGAGPIDQAAVIPCPLREVWNIGCA